MGGILAWRLRHTSVSPWVAPWQGHLELVLPLCRDDCWKLGRDDGPHRVSWGCQDCLGRVLTQSIRSLEKIDVLFQRAHCWLCCGRAQRTFPPRGDKPCAGEKALASFRSSARAAVCRPGLTLEVPSRNWTLSCQQGGSILGAAAARCNAELPGRDRHSY